MQQSNGARIGPGARKPSPGTRQSKQHVQWHCSASQSRKCRRAHATSSGAIEQQRTTSPASPRSLVQSSNPQTLIRSNSTLPVRTVASLKFSWRSHVLSLGLPVAIGLINRLIRLISRLGLGLQPSRLRLRLRLINRLIRSISRLRLQSSAVNSTSPVRMVASLKSRW